MICKTLTGFRVTIVGLVRIYSKLLSMNNILKAIKAFFIGVFTKTKKVIIFPQEEEQDMIGV